MTITSMITHQNVFYDYLQYFPDKMETSAVENIVMVPKEIGSGFIKWYVLDRGLGLRFYSFTADRDIEYKMFTPEEQGWIYKMTYSLENTSELFSETDNDRMVYFNSSEMDRKFIIRKGEYMCRVVLLFSKQWLEKNHPQAASRIHELLNVMVNVNKPAVIEQTLDLKSYSRVRQLCHGMSHLSLPPIKIKMDSFILMNTFFNNITGNDSKEILSKNSGHFQTIVKIEERLSQSVGQQPFRLPNIGDLAEEYHISISTLRRHFKIVFGRNIYDYFQSKRMQWAKMKLEKGGSNVSEISRELGFLKPDNFSKAFRKEFNMLPNQVKQ